MRRYLFGKTILDIPDGHKIREIHKQDSLYDRAFGFILEAIAARSPDSVFIDIGANIGDTAATMAGYVGNPILSVEGGEDFLPYLRSNTALLGDQVSLIEKFVRSDSLSSARLRYNSGLGTGALQVSEDGGLDESRFISVRDLLERARTRSPRLGLIKSDTDGVDGFLVQDYLQHADCPLFFECDTVNTIGGIPSPWPTVFQMLSYRNYSVVIYDNFGLPLCVAAKDPGQILRDLSGYIHMQYCAQPIRLYYLDIWAFPPAETELFEQVAQQVRSRFLRPFGF